MSAAVETTQSIATDLGAQPRVIDLAALLSPIAGENPGGENLQYSGVYDEIREARRADDTLTKGDWETEPKQSEWYKVVDLTTNALTSQSKDLQIAAWLVEAIVVQHGFVGLRDGLLLLQGLHEQYWDQLYPPIDDGDLEARANILAALDTHLELPLKSVPLTKSETGVDYSYLQWEDSVKFDFPENLETLDADAYSRAANLKAEAEAANKTTSDLWRKAKDKTRRAFYEETFATLNICWQLFQTLDQLIDQKFGRQTPGLGTIRKSLDAIKTLVEKLVKEKRILEPDPVAEATSTDTGTNGEGNSSSSDPVQGRAEALRKLAEVAHYFQRTEPHSPVAYLVQRAIKWGQMPLELWLEDVIKDNGVLGQLRETLGLDTQGEVQPPE